MIRAANVLGCELAVLFDGVHSAGQHEIVFDRQGMPSGVYLVRMTADGFAQTRTVTLLR